MLTNQASLPQSLLKYWPRVWIERNCRQLRCTIATVVNSIISKSTIHDPKFHNPKFHNPRCCRFIVLFAVSIRRYFSQVPQGWYLGALLVQTNSRLIVFRHDQPMPSYGQYRKRIQQPDRVRTPKKPKKNPMLLETDQTCLTPYFRDRS